MSIDKIKERLKKNARQDSTWLERARYRKENRAWLDISFAIAVKISSSLKKNKTADIFPSTQKELAEAMGCSPQYVNKLLKGAENLQLETITKVEEILNITLIEVPEYRTSVQLKVEASIKPTKFSNLMKIEANSFSTNYDELSKTYSYENESDTSIKSVA